MAKFSAFTLKGEAQLDRLNTEVLILSDLRKNREARPRMWKGLWDTGASRSTITQRIVDYFGLIPIGNTNISTANGITVAKTYYIDMGLPNGVLVRDVLVSCADLGPDLDVLIGMDIIKHGDFAITNKNKKTTFSFRIPSINEIDYCKEETKTQKADDKKISDHNK